MLSYIWRGGVKMKDHYSLTEEPFSRNLFVPHDFVVKQIKLTSDELTFVFEDDITYHDGIKEMFPDKKSLVLHFHLIDETLFAYREKRKRFAWHKHGYFDFEERKLPDLCKQRLEYIDHLFSYQSIMIELWTASGALWIKANADFVEYEWLE